MAINKSITELVGGTPLLELTNYETQNNLQASIITKLEYFNPNHSVKDRTALAIIEEAEANGDLKAGDTIVEVTSGNTGIGLAAIAAAKGYPLRIYIQDNVSEERYKIIKAFGAEIIPLFSDPLVAEFIAEAEGDLVAAINALAEYFAKDDQLFFANQMANLANRGIHQATTGPEIWEATNGDVDIIVGAVGTGGTISGAGEFLKSKNPDIKVIAVEPTPESLSTPEKEVDEIIGVHPFTYVPKEWVPVNFNQDLYDEGISVSTEQAYETIREVAKSDGVLLGVSSGASIYAATELAKRPENKGKKIVVIAADSGLTYLSTNAYL